MELRHLRAFVAVAEAEGFSAAARRLGTAQPPLSRQVRALEDELGVELLVRGRRVRPTPAGEAFLHEARTALLAVDHAVEAARRAARGEIGELRVGFVGPVYEVLPQLVAAFRRTAPEVTLALSRSTTARMLDQLRTGALDAAFVAPPLPGGGLLTEEVLRYALVAAVPAGHPAAQAGRVALTDLRDDSWVVLPDPTAGLTGFVVAACREQGFYPVLAREAAEVDLLLALVAAGEGVSLIPDGPEARPTPGVTYVPLDRPLELPVALAWPADTPSRVRGAFVALTRSLLAA